MNPQYFSHLPVGARWRHATQGCGEVFVKISATSAQCLASPRDPRHFQPGSSYVFGESVNCRVIPFELRHPGDPHSPPRLWSYVYLHGKAEARSTLIGRRNGWENSAPNLCCCADTPLPTLDGEYDGILYGVPAKIVLARSPGGGGVFGGRVVLVNDPKGLAHARAVADWM